MLNLVERIVRLITGFHAAIQRIDCRKVDSCLFTEGRTLKLTKEKTGEELARYRLAS